MKHTTYKTNKTPLSAGNGSVQRDKVEESISAICFMDTGLETYLMALSRQSNYKRGLSGISSSVLKRRSF